jgi:hypothetical protein
MTLIERTRIAEWLAPTFLLALIAVYLFAPFPFIDKLNGVCFGI